MSYFNLRPVIKSYKKQIFDKYGIVIKKVKWSKEQLDLMQKSLGFSFDNKYESEVKSYEWNNERSVRRFKTKEI